MFKNRCYKGGDKHNFKPRFEKQETNLLSQEGDIKIDTRYNLKDLLYRDVYLCDICVWCGKKVGR